MQNSFGIAVNSMRKRISPLYWGNLSLPPLFFVPIVTIKAKNKEAQHVKKPTAKVGIPMMENVPLARALYAQAELENYISSELIEPVAEVLNG